MAGSAASGGRSSRLGLRGTGLERRGGSRSSSSLSGNASPGDELVPRSGAASGSSKSSGVLESEGIGVGRSRSASRSMPWSAVGGGVAGAGPGRPTISGAASHGAPSRSMGTESGSPLSRSSSRPGGGAELNPEAGPMSRSMSPTSRPGSSGSFTGSAAGGVFGASRAASGTRPTESTRAGPLAGGRKLLRSDFGERRAASSLCGRPNCELGGGGSRPGGTDE